MKIHARFLIGTMTMLTYFGNVNAEAISTSNLCPEGCFCVDGGYFNNNSRTNVLEFCGSGARKLEGNALKNLSFLLIPQNTVGTENNTFNLSDLSSTSTDNILEEMYIISKTNVYADGSGTDTYIDYYGVKNNTFYEGVKYLRNIHVCPQTYPYSAKGSKSLSDCFKYDTNGNKIYYDGSVNYRSCDVNGIRKTVENLQHALIKAAQDLQDALEKNNSDMTLDEIKALIESSGYVTNSDTIDLSKALGQTGTQYTNGGTIDLSEVFGQTETSSAEKKKNLIKKDKLESIKKTDTPKRAASGPFKSNILNSYAGAQ